LDQVDKLQGPKHRSLEIDGIKLTALNCREPLEAFLNKVQKYGPSLRYGTKGSLKRVARRMEWAWVEKEQVDRLRSYLNIHIGTINMNLINHGLVGLETLSKHAEHDSNDVRQQLECASQH